MDCVLRAQTAQRRVWWGAVLGSAVLVGASVGVLSFARGETPSLRADETGGDTRTAEEPASPRAGTDTDAQAFARLALSARGSRADETTSAAPGHTSSVRDETPPPPSPRLPPPFERARLATRGANDSPLALSDVRFAPRRQTLEWTGDAPASVSAGVAGAAGCDVRTMQSAGVPPKALGRIFAAAAQGDVVPNGLAPVDTNLFYSWQGRAWQLTLEWTHDEPPRYAVSLFSFADTRFADPRAEREVLGTPDGETFPYADAHALLARTHHTLVDGGATFLTRTGVFVNVLKRADGSAASTAWANTALSSVEIHGGTIVSVTSPEATCQTREESLTLLSCACRPASETRTETNVMPRGRAPEEGGLQEPPTSP